MTKNEQALAKAIVIQRNLEQVCITCGCISKHLIDGSCPICYEAMLPINIDELLTMKGDI